MKGGFLLCGVVSVGLEFVRSNIMVLSLDKINCAPSNRKNFGHVNGTPYQPHPHESQKKRGT